MPSVSVASSRARRFAFPLAAATLLGLVATLLSPTAAQAVPLLTVTVVGPTGTPMPSLPVTILNADTEAFVDTVNTSSAGVLTTSLVPGDYTLKFAATSTTYAQYLGGGTSFFNAQHIPLLDMAGSARVVRATLSAAGKVGGKVTTTSGTAISGATVTVYRAKDAKWIVAKTATTSSSGTYSVSGLEPGDYRVQARKGTTYAPLYSGGAASIVAASDVGVFPAKTTTTNFKLGTSAKVIGTVRADTGSGAAPLAGVTVTAWRFVGPATPTAAVEQLAATATTSATGAYTLTGLPPGDYTLYFTAPDSSDAGSTFLGGASDPNDALSFVVGSGATVTGKNALLTAEGTVSGVLREQGTLTPLPNVRVSLYTDGDDPDAPLVKPIAVTFTQAGGVFELDNLGPGAYDIVFGAFEQSTPAEDIGWERRGWSTINLTEGEDEPSIVRDTKVRVAPSPVSGSEPSVVFPGYLTGQVGSYVDASPGTWAPSTGYPVTGGYRWYRDGERIPNESGSQYALRPGDIGHNISAEAWRLDWASGYGESRTNAVGPVLEGPAPTRIGPMPTVVGTREVGRTLTVDPGTWEVIDYSNDSDGADLGIVWTYQWERSTDFTTWTPIAGATGPTRVVAPEDVVNGPYLRAVLHGERYGYADVDTETLPAFVETGEFLPVTAPKVTSTKTAWKVTPGTWSPTPSTVGYKWTTYDAANSPNVSPNTTSTFPKSGTSGKKVTVTITYDGPELDPEVVELLVQRGKAPTATGSLTVTGTPRVGEMLTAPSLTWSFTPGSITYKWQYLSGSTWRTISGATASTYTPTATYKGKKLRVIQTAINAGYSNASKTSKTTAAVATGLALSPTVAPSFTSFPAAGTTATVDPGTTTPAATSVSYVWKSGPTGAGPWTTISGATSASYTIPASFTPGRWLQVTVTAKRTGYASLVQQLTSDVWGKLANTTLPTVGEVSGSPGVYEVTSVGTWNPAQDANQYQWFILLPDGTEAVYGTTATYDTNFSGLYQPMDLVVTAQKSGWAEGSIRIPVKNGVFQYNDPASIQGGMAQVGVKLTATDPNLYNAPIGASLTRHWEWESAPGVWSPIAGATASTWTPTATYLGEDIRFRVTSTKARYTASDSISGVLTVGAAPAPAPGTGGNAPSFSTAPKVGVKLTLSLGTWNVAGASYAYQWQSRPTSGDSWANIAGATGASYTPDASRAGHQLQVRVTATKTGHPQAVVELEPSPVTIAPGSLVATKAPTVAKSGAVLTASPGTWNVSGTTISYEWFRALPDTSVQSVGTARSYTLTADDAGNRIYVEVKAQKAGYDDGYAAATGQAGPKLQPTSTITITGDRVVGQTLTMATGFSWNTGLAVPAYQWLRNGVAIPGATSTSYTATAADLGKTIALKVTATATGYPSYSSTVSAGVIAAAAPPVNSVAPKLSVVGGGNPVTGRTVSTTTGTWSIIGGTFTYQWYRGGDKIVGATASTYQLTPADVAAELSARVTFSKPGIQSASARTQLATVLPAAAVEGTTPVVTLSGTTLKVGTVTWDLPVTVTYQWQESMDGTTWSDIIGATATTLPESEVAFGHYVRVVVIGTRPGYQRAELPSAGLFDPIP